MCIRLVTGLRDRYAVMCIAMSQVYLADMHIFVLLCNMFICQIYSYIASYTEQLCLLFWNRFMWQIYSYIPSTLQRTEQICVLLCHMFMWQICSYVYCYVTGVCGRYAVMCIVMSQVYVADMQLHSVHTAPYSTDICIAMSQVYVADMQLYVLFCNRFMWQICSYIPSTLPRTDPGHSVSLMATQLSASFILETLLHAKEKVGYPTISPNSSNVIYIYSKM